MSEGNTWGVYTPCYDHPTVDIKSGNLVAVTLTVCDCRQLQEHITDDNVQSEPIRKVRLV